MVSRGPSPSSPLSSSSPPHFPYLEGARGVLVRVQRHGHVRPQKFAPGLCGRFLEVGRLEPGAHRGALVRDLASAGDFQQQGIGNAVEGVLVRMTVVATGRRQAEGDEEAVGLAEAHAAPAFVGGGRNRNGVLGRRRRGTLKNLNI